MRNYLNYTLKQSTRQGIRSELVTEFLRETPGTGTAHNCSFYEYTVDTLSSGSRVILKRPARLNKGFDFEVHIENINFGIKRRRSMPSHSDLADDLTNKKKEDGNEFAKAKLIIDKLYHLQPVTHQEILAINFKSGFPFEIIAFAIKWLFIEQDVTYWNWSGRAMLYKHLKSI